MTENIFVNEAINIGITNYINQINENDFLTIIIKTLINIYGELDILNPYKTKNENNLGGFDSNLNKFDFSKERISLFKQNVLNFHLTKNIMPNQLFNQIEKDLIDMYFYKKNSLGLDDSNDQAFFDLLLVENTELNNKYSSDKKEIKKYFDYKKKMLNTKIEYNKVEKNTLSKEAYELAGYSYDNILNINEVELTKINLKVFEFFKIKNEDENKFVRLEQAIEFYKEFLKDKEEEVKTHGEGGHVEFMLLLGFISISIITIILVVGILVR